MVSIGEAVVIVGAAFVILSPKDVPRYARALGRWAGRASAHVQTARSKFLNFSEQTELQQLHQEMQTTMRQLDSIRAEIRGGMNILQPGPLMNRAMSHMESRTGSGEKNGSFSAQPAPSRAAGEQEEHPVQASPGIVAAPWPAAPVAAAASAPARAEPGDASAIPVSAVAAGLAPDRTGQTPSGSEIMLDALMEERVASDAASFLTRSPPRATV